MKMKSKWIKFLSSSEFDEIRKNCKTVILPVGATEVYGPHMPLGSDIIVAQDIAELVAEQTNALVGPSLEVGESYSLSNYPGTLLLQPETWKAVVTGYMHSLMKWGFTQFMFINGHAGNVPIITQICRPLQREHGIKTAQIDWWRFTQAKAKGICEYEGWMCHGHASECGTSVMLYLHPEYVDMDKARRVTPKQGEAYGKYSDFITYAPFSDTTECGILGDATVATAEKGRLIVEKCVQRIVEYMHEEFQC